VRLNFYIANTAFCNDTRAATTSLTIQQYLDGLCAALTAGKTRAEYHASLLPYIVFLPYQPVTWTNTTAETYPGLAGDDEFLLEIPADSSRPYQLWLEGYGHLKYWYDCPWDQQVNAPDTLTFTYPADAEDGFSPYLKQPNYIMVQNADGYCLQRFRILDPLPNKQRNGAELTISVTCESLLGQLRDEYVNSYVSGGGLTLYQDTELSPDQFWITDTSQFPSGTCVVLIDEEQCLGALDGSWFVVTTRGYNGTAEVEHQKGAYIHVGRTIKDHAEYLLNHYQLFETPITIGSIYDGIGDGIFFTSFENKNLLECIDELHRLSGSTGQYTVTQDGKFEWRERLGTDGGTIGLGLNILSLARTVNYDNLATKLYVYGGGLSMATRPVAVKTNNVATYGTITKRVFVNDVRDAATLDAIATNLIAVVSEPEVSYRIPAVDLYALGSGPYISIGSALEVVDADLEIDTTQTVVSISRTLDVPDDVTYELANPAAQRKETIEDLLSKLIKRVDVQESRDFTQDINRAIRAANITGVSRTNPVATPLEADMDTSDGLVYYIDDAGETVHVPRYEPAEGDEVEGDLRINQADRIEHWDGDEWQTDALLSDVATVAGTIPEAGTGVLAVGAANSDGTGTDYALVNHVHSGAQPGTGIVAVGTANANGSSAAYARVDHVHAGLWVEYTGA